MYFPQYYIYCCLQYSVRDYYIFSCYLCIMGVKVININKIGSFCLHLLYRKTIYRHYSI